MLFLTNKKQKEKILEIYYTSLINIFSISLFVLFIILLVFIFPTYLTIKVDKKAISDKISSLQNEINSYNITNKIGENVSIDNDISILAATTPDEALVIYQDIKDIYNSVPNVKLTGININTSTKSVTVNAVIDNKDTASLIVDRLNNSNYKGAELPYSVFSQNKRFVFNQNLTYE